MTVLLWLQSIHNPFLDAFFGVITFLGDEVLIVAAMGWFLWCWDRKFGIKLGMAFFVGGVTAQILKLQFMVPRPWVLEPRLVPDAIAIARATGPSFPSGHTMVATVMFASLFFYVKKRNQKVLCVTAIILVAFSRMYLLVHTPQDVLVSLVIGSVLAWLFWYREKVPKLRFVLMGLMVLVMGGLAATCFKSGLETKDLDNALAAGGAALGFFLGFLVMRKMKWETKRSGKWWLIFPLGLLGVGVILYGLPLLLPTPLPVLTYSLVGFWAVAGYPALCSLAAKKRTS